MRANVTKMPLVGGAMSTRMIRHYEKTFEERRRVPIIAVSASLVQSSRFDYIESGYENATPGLGNPLPFQSHNPIQQLS